MRAHMFDDPPPLETDAIFGDLWDVFYLSNQTRWPRTLGPCLNALTRSWSNPNPVPFQTHFTLTHAFSEELDVELHRRYTEAKAALEVGNPLEAVSQLERMGPLLDMFEADLESMAHYHHTCGDALSALERCPDALKHYQEGLRLRKLEDGYTPHLEQVRSYLAIGQTLHHLERDGEALEVFGQVLKQLGLLEARGESSPADPLLALRGHTHMQMGHVLTALKRPSEALEATRLAMAVEKRLAQAAGVPTSHGSPQWMDGYARLYALAPLIDAARARGEHASEVRLLREALEVGRSHFFAADEALGTTHSELGNALMRLGDYPAALLEHTAALERFQRAYPDTPHAHIALARMHLGADLDGLGRCDEALSQFGAALRTLSLLEVSPHTLEIKAGVLGNLSGTLLALGRKAEACQTAARVLELQRVRHPDAPRSEVVVAHCNLAAMFQGLDQLESARAHYTLALEMQLSMTRDQPHPTTVACLTGLGTVLILLGHSQQARNRLEEAVRLGEALEGQPISPHLPMARISLGGALLASGQLTDALFQQQQALHELIKLYGEHPRPEFMSVQAHLGNAQSRLNRLDLAVEHWAQSLRIALKLQHNLSGVLSAAEVLGHTREHLSTLHTVLNTLAQMQSRGVAQGSHTLRQVAELWFSFKGSAGALEADGLHLVGRYPQLEPQFKALRAAKRSLSVLLTRSASNSEEAAQLRQGQQALTDQVAHLEQDLRRATLGRFDLGELTLERILGGLREGEAYLDFALLRESLFAFTLAKIGGRGQLHFHALGLAPTLLDDLTELRESLEPHRVGERYAVPRLLETFQAPQGTAARLYARLIAPLETALSHAHRVIVSPDGPLHFLPFDLLYNPVRAEFLIERFTLCLLPGARDVVRLHESRTRPPGNARTQKGAAILLGDPDFAASWEAIEAAVGQATALEPRAAQDEPHAPSLAAFLQGGSDAPLPPLPRSRSQVLEIARSLDALGVPARVFLGAAASQATLERVDTPHLLHLTTHGAVLEGGTLEAELKERLQDPLMRAWLMLAGADDADRKRFEGEGLASAAWLATLDLEGTELVTLAACHSAQGHALVAEGASGFPRALMLAGARATLGALWAVEEQATRLLMVEFYTRWLGAEPPRDPAGALAQLKRDWIGKGRAPATWAGFVLHG